MLRNLFLKTLRDQRKSLFWWSVSLVAFGAIMIAFYPAVKSAPEYDKLLQREDLRVLFEAILGGEVISITNPVGYLNGEVFSLMYPIIILVFVLIFSATTLAGEEKRGSLDLLLSNPLPRWRVVLEKFLALVVSLIIISTIFWLALVIGALIINMDISFARLAEVIISSGMLGVLFGSIAIFFSSLSGRGLSFGLTGVLIIGAYLLNTFARLVDFLEPFKVISPFYYYNSANPLANGLDVVHVGVLLVSTILFLAASLFAIERRDLGTK